MGLLPQKRTHPDLRFSTRAEAFSYMLVYMTEERNADPLEAAQKANEFADIFAQNMGIPLKSEPEPKGVDKYLSMATKIADYIESHPKIVEYGIPAVTFIAGLFTGKKVEQAADSNTLPAQEPPQKIDFENIPE